MPLGHSNLCDHRNLWVAYCSHLDADGMQCHATIDVERMVEALEKIATEGTITDREIAVRALGYEDWEHFDRRDL